jgi:hypothetical protein
MELAGIFFTKLFSSILFSGGVRIRNFVVKLPRFLKIVRRHIAGMCSLPFC